jgi:hexosaminidase
MSPEQAKHVLGTQFQLWSEYIPNPKHMEYMMFPRGCALAEVAWTDVARKDLDDFLLRMKEHSKRLEILDVNFRRGN